MAKKKQSKAGSIREAIRVEVANRNLSGYRLVKMLDGQVSRTAIYRFLAGDGASTDVATAEKFLEVLDLRVVSNRSN